MASIFILYRLYGPVLIWDSVTLKPRLVSNSLQSSLSLPNADIVDATIWLSKNLHSLVDVANNELAYYLTVFSLRKFLAGSK